MRFGKSRKNGKKVKKQNNSLHNNNSRNFCRLCNQACRLAACTGKKLQESCRKINGIYRKNRRNKGRNR